MSKTKEYKNLKKQSQGNFNATLVFFIIKKKKYNLKTTFIKIFFLNFFLLHKYKNKLYWIKIFCAEVTGRLMKNFFKKYPLEELMWQKLNNI